MPTCAIGLAHHVMFPDVAEPAGWDEPCDDVPCDDEVDPQAASTNAEVATAKVTVLVLLNENLFLDESILFIFHFPS
jgi:hypothetical protein